MPFSPLSPYEEFLSKVKDLKANPKTYRVYSYSTRNAGSITLEVFGNRIYFGNVPGRMTVRFNEPETDPIEVTKAIGIQQDFYRVILEWDATGTDDRIYFVAGFDIDFIDLTRLTDRVKKLLYNTIPLTIAENAKTLGVFKVSQADYITLDYISDIAGNVNIHISNDGLTWYGVQAYAVVANAYASYTIPVVNDYISIEFVKAVPGTPQTMLYLSARVK